MKVIRCINRLPPSMSTPLMLCLLAADGRPLLPSPLPVSTMSLDVVVKKKRRCSAPMYAVVRRWRLGIAGTAAMRRPKEWKCFAAIECAPRPPVFPCLPSRQSQNRSDRTAINVISDKKRSAWEDDKKRKGRRTYQGRLRERQKRRRRRQKSERWLKQQKFFFTLFPYC